MNNFRKSEAELKRTAAQIAENITISNTGTARIANTYEWEIIYNLAYGALMEINYEAKYAETNIIMAIAGTAENALKLFFDHCDAYYTVYLPIRKTAEAWAKEAEEKKD